MSAKAKGSESAAQELSEEEQASVELSRMITELNEVRMRLDSVVRKIGSTNSLEIDIAEEDAGSVDVLRNRIVDQVDRIREKLVLRARTLNDS